jgi:hypothetical protein
MERMMTKIVRVLSLSGALVFSSVSLSAESRHSHRYSHLKGCQFVFEGHSDEALIGELLEFANQELPPAYSKLYGSILRGWWGAGNESSSQANQSPDAHAGPDSKLDILRSISAEDFVSTASIMLPRVESEIDAVKEIPAAAELLRDFKRLIENFVAAPNPAYIDWLLIGDLWGVLADLQHLRNDTGYISKYRKFEDFRSMIAELFDAVLRNQTGSKVEINKQRFFSESSDPYDSPNYHTLSDRALEVFPFYISVPTRRLISFANLNNMLALGLLPQQITVKPIKVHRREFAPSSVYRHDSSHNLRVRGVGRRSAKLSGSKYQTLIEMVARLRLHKHYLGSDFRQSKTSIEKNLLDFFWMGLQHEEPYGLDLHNESRSVVSDVGKQLMALLFRPGDAGDYVKGVSSISGEQRAALFSQLVEFLGL